MATLAVKTSGLTPREGSRGGPGRTRLAAPGRPLAAASGSWCRGRWWRGTAPRRRGRGLGPSRWRTRSTPARAVPCRRWPVARDAGVAWGLSTRALPSLAASSGPRPAWFWCDCRCGCAQRSAAGAHGTAAGAGGSGACSPGLSSNCPLCLGAPRPQANPEGRSTCRPCPAGPRVGPRSRLSGVWAAQALGPPPGSYRAGGGPGLLKGT